jgi:acyl-CoA thioester hydrolase
MTPHGMEYDVEIRWSDIDSYGHVQHAAQVMILEHGRTRRLDALLAPGGGTWDYAVVRMEIDYRAELRYQDRLARCTFTVEKLGSSSVTLAEAILRPDGGVATEARTVIVAWEPSSGGARALTEHERAALAGGIVGERSADHVGDPLDR